MTRKLNEKSLKLTPMGTVLSAPIFGTGPILGLRYAELCVNHVSGIITVREMEGGTNMQYTVFLRNGKDGRYIAQVPSWPECASEGQTRKEALENVRKTLKEMLKGVVEITQVKVDVPKTGKTKSDPWLEFRGMFADDPDFDDFMLEIKAYRKELNSE